MRDEMLFLRGHPPVRWSELMARPREGAEETARRIMSVLRVLWGAAIVGGMLVAVAIAGLLGLIELDDYITEVVRLCIWAFASSGGLATAIACSVLAQRQQGILRQVRAAPDKPWFFHPWWPRGTFVRRLMPARTAIFAVAALLFFAVALAIALTAVGFLNFGKGAMRTLAVVYPMGMAALMAFVCGREVWRFRGVGRYRLELKTLPAWLGQDFRARLRIRIARRGEGGFRVGLVHRLQMKGQGMGQASPALPFVALGDIYRTLPDDAIRRDGRWVEADIQLELPEADPALPTRRFAGLPWEAGWWLEVEGTGAWSGIRFLDPVPVFAAEEGA